MLDVQVCTCVCLLLYLGAAPADHGCPGSLESWPLTDPGCYRATASKAGMHLLFICRCLWGQTVPPLLCCCCRGLNPVVPMKYALLHHILLWMHLSSFANSIAFAKGQTRYMSSTSTSLQLVGNAGEFDLHHFRLVCLIMLGYLQPLDVANASQLLQDSRLPGGG